MDAAEQHIRLAGYHGFSFREIATEVGIKSSSVHHYFPTKESLGVAVAQRYTKRFYEGLPPGSEKPHLILRKAFLKAMERDRLICLCGSLGAGANALPNAVAQEAKRFFEQGIRFLTSGTPHASTAFKNWALQVLAQLEGAMIVAIALGDTNVFFRATQALPDPPNSSV